MPQFIPMALGLGMSAAQGFLGGNKPKQESSATSTNTTSRTAEQTSNQQSEQQRKFNENPLFGQAREALLPLFASELNKAQKPIYGQAQQAGFMQQLNELASSAMQRMTQGVAGSGGMRGGRFAGGTADIEKARFGEASKFFQGLPAQEEAARSGRVNNLMGLATKWLGMGPVDETVTGEANSNTKTNETSTSTGSQTGTQTQDDGQGGWRGMLRNGLGFGGGVLGDVLGGNGSRWGIGGRPGGGGFDQYDPLAGSWQGK